MNRPPRVGWGFIGTGLMAALFADDLQFVPDAAVVAVTSRNRSSADAFADRFGIPNRYDSYEALLADPRVDVVYIATPHPMHFDAARLAVSAGKAVLCEKPLTLNGSEARRLVNAAREAGTFLMEAMWTRFVPHMVRIRELLVEGALGDIRQVQADHGLLLERPPDHRLLAPRLGGGVLLDLGVYPVSFASFVLGAPERIVALSSPASTGVDAQTSVLLEHPGGRQAVLTTTLDAQTPNRAAISGIEARIEIEPVWYTPSAFTITKSSGASERFSFPNQGRGTHYEAAEVARCLREGLSESAVMPLDESITIMETMDEVRRQIGLRYPSESEPESLR